MSPVNDYEDDLAFDRMVTEMAKEKTQPPEKVYINGVGEAIDAKELPEASGYLYHHDRVVKQLEEENARLLKAGTDYAEMVKDIYDKSHAVLGERDRLREAVRGMAVALGFYGDPATYFAISVLNDPPCGAFIDDYNFLTEWQKTIWDDYREGDPYYGKTARECLEDHADIIEETRG